MYLLGNSFNNQLILILNETFDEELKLNHGSNWKLLAGGFRITTYMHLFTQKHHKLHKLVAVFLEFIRRIKFCFGTPWHQSHYIAEHKTQSHLPCMGYLL